MGQLVFNIVRTKAQHFVEDSSGHSTKAMGTHFVLGNPKTSHSAQKGIVTHGPCFSAGIGKDIAAISSEGPNLLENGNGLTGKRNNMGCFCFLNEVSPFPPIEVNIFPLGLAKLSRANKDEGSEAKGATNNEGSLVTVNGAEDSRSLLWLCRRGQMPLFDGGKCPFKAFTRVGCSTFRSYGVPKKLASKFLKACGPFPMPLGPLYDGQLSAS